MIPNRPRNVLACFEMLLEVIALEIDLTRRVGAPVLDQSPGRHLR